MKSKYELGYLVDILFSGYEIGSEIIVIYQIQRAEPCLEHLFFRFKEKKLAEKLNL